MNEEGHAAFVERIGEGVDVAGDHAQVALQGRDLHATLLGTGRTHTTDRRHTRLRASLVVSQVALALVRAFEASLRAVKHVPGVVRDAILQWQVRRPGLQPWGLPVVAETYDGGLNDINGFHVKPAHVISALDGDGAPDGVDPGVGESPSWPDGQLEPDLVVADAPGPPRAGRSSSKSVISS